MAKNSPRQTFPLCQQLVLLHASLIYLKMHLIVRTSSPIPSGTMLVRDQRLLQLTPLPPLHLRELRLPPPFPLCRIPVPPDPLQHLCEPPLLERLRIADDRLIPDHDERVARKWQVEAVENGVEEREIGASVAWDERWVVRWSVEAGKEGEEFLGLSCRSEECQFG